MFDPDAADSAFDDLVDTVQQAADAGDTASNDGDIVQDLRNALDNFNSAS